MSGFGLIEILVYWLIAINFVAFAAFGIDKAQAENGGWRVRESTLAFYAALGGLAGALAGRRVFRHKTRKQSFTDKLWGSAIASALLFGGGTYAYINHLKPLDPAEAAKAQALMMSVTYAGCNEVRAAGKAPLRYGEPGYRETMDGDGDGQACEPVY